MSLRLAFTLLLLAGFAPVAARAQAAPGAPWEQVEKALGRAGEDRDGVYRLAFPRSDLHVRVGGVTVRPALALTSWAAFQRTATETMVMGDLVLLAQEVSPVVSRLSEGGIVITALHNHLLGEAPRVMYLHFHGHGAAAQLASALRAALTLTGTPLAAARTRATPEAAGPEAEKPSQILGYTGTLRSGVLSFSIPRAEKITAGGTTLGPRMGLATAINFQVEGSGAATTGDFVLLPSEVQTVIRTLREHEIEVTALHNHMLDEEPRLFFLHFWGRGEAHTLATGLRTALDKTRHAASR